jgi:hypothetical protein
MPYLNNYEKLLIDNQCTYTLLHWDRFNIDDSNNEFRYIDGKIGHKRNMIDYYRFSKFIKRILSKNEFDKIIVFGIPILLFIGGVLTKRYRGNYIIDVRDYHKIVKVCNLKNIIKDSAYTVISSPDYKKWLPDNDKYLVNHNLNIDNYNDCLDESIKNRLKLNISFIGATRDYEINIDLISSLSESKCIDVYYHGEGDINPLIDEYIKKKNVKNAFLTGRYSKKDEGILYHKSDLINVLRLNDSINNETALPNRLYNAEYYCKPMLAYEGTYLSEIINKYNLGLVINTFENLEMVIKNYFDNFEYDKYISGRAEFLNMAINDNKKFILAIKSFLNEQSD